MTVQSETAKAVYVADGTGVSYVVPFYFLDKEVAVYFDTSPTPLTEGTDYTITGAGEPTGGEITFATAPAAGTVVTVLRDVALKQLVKFLEGEKFPASDYEYSLDKIIMALQQLKEHLGKCIAIPNALSLTKEDFENLIFELNQNLTTIRNLPEMLQSMLEANINIVETLANYSLKSEVTTALDDYYTKSDINARLTLITGYRFHNVSLLLEDIAEDVNHTYEDYPYIGTIYLSVASSSQIPVVTFGLEDALSGNFAPIADTGNGCVYVYLKEIPSQNVTIKSILLY